VELSLAEARVESCRRKVEAEMQLKAEQQVIIEISEAEICIKISLDWLTVPLLTHSFLAGLNAWLLAADPFLGRMP